METTSARPVIVEPGGSGVVANVGLHALCAFADRLRLGAVLSSAIPKRSERFALHDRGKVLVQLMAVIAGGGESCADIEYLRREPSLFGFVPSDSTSSASMGHSPPHDRRRSGGASSTLRDASSDPRVARSCACSTAGPTPRPCCPPTDGSRSSPERHQIKGSAPPGFATPTTGSKTDEQAKWRSAGPRRSLNHRSRRERPPEHGRRACSGILVASA